MMSELSPLLREIDFSIDELENYNNYDFGGTADISSGIVAALRDGDERAYTSIFNAYHAPIKNYLNKALRNEDEAQEITQRVFINLWLKREKLDPTQNIKGFLFQTSFFYLYNRFRREKTASTYDKFMAKEYSFDDSPEDIISAKELTLLAEITISRMPAKQRQVFEMRCYESKSYKDIAEILDISPLTVKKHLERGRKELREVLRMFITLFLVA